MQRGLQLTNELESLIDKLHINRKIRNKCWIWTAGISGDYYGKVKYLGRTFRVHRIVAWLCLGLDIEDSEMQVLHKKECTSRLCFNPLHLYLGDHFQNMQDRKEQGNYENKIKTHCIHGHEFTSENTYWWYGRRQCIECRNRIAKERIR